MFTQRHYIKIAQVLRDMYMVGTVEDGQVDYMKLVDIFDKEFTNDNPKFDSTRFHKAVLEGVTKNG